MDDNPYKASQAVTPRRKCRHRARIQAREYFGLVIRTIGLLTLAMSVWNNAGGLVLPAPGFERLDYILPMVPGVLIGAIALFSADAIARFSYREELWLDDEPPAD